MSEPNIIIGIDEAGMGALAGPLVVCAAAFERDASPVTATFRGLRGDVVVTAGDSKSFRNPTHREVLATAIRGSAHALTLIERSNKEIDARLISAIFPEALRLAAARCIEQIVLRGKFTDPRHFLIVIDGDVTVPDGLPCPIRAIPDGDKKIWQIGAASIVAKTVRDSHMTALASRHPEYDFERNKGYPTPDHKRRIKAHGPSSVHRKTFRPVAEADGPKPGFET
jgi:ribonuclease HII